MTYVLKGSEVSLLLTMFPGNGTTRRRRKNLRLSSTANHQLHSDLNLALSGSTSLPTQSICLYNTHCHLKHIHYIYIHIVVNPLTARLWSTSSSVSGIIATHNASTSIAKIASGRCPPVKHCVSPSTNHLCRKTVK